MSSSFADHLVEFPLSQHPAWKVITYQSYQDYVQGEAEADLSLCELVQYTKENNRNDNFIWPVEIGSVQFITGVFVEKKIIKLASKQLNRELTLINADEENNVKSYLELKEFTASIAEIPVHNSPTTIEFISLKYDLPLFNKNEDRFLHEKTLQLSNELVAKISEYKPTLFEKISDFSLDLVANFMLIRIHLLKFLAILPCLDHDESGHEVKRIFLETLTRLINDSKMARRKKLKGQKRALPSLYFYLTKITLALSEFVPAFILSLLIRKTTEILATRFIAGRDIGDAQKTLQQIGASNREATIDQLGELVVSTKEADHYTNKVLEIIKGLNNVVEKGSVNSAGIEKAHVSVKVTALAHDFKPQDFDYTFKIIAPRLTQILITAKEHAVFVNIDAEHYHYRDCVFQIFKKILLETPELKDYKACGIVLQAYLKDSYIHLLDILDLAKERGTRMPIRLVKGAYWDAETIEAEAHNFESPQFINKDETDLHFRQMASVILENHQHLQLSIASHNLKDHCFVEILRKERFPAAPVIEHQCLHMTYEALSIGMSKMGWPTRNYIPVGNLLVGMAYLVRRIMENSSQVGVLTMMRSHKKSLDPKDPAQSLKILKDKMLIERESSLITMSRQFRNIYPLRTYLKNHLARVDQKVKADLEKLKRNELVYDLGEQKIYSNSKQNLLLGKIKYHSKEETNKIINQLFDGFNKSNWSTHFYTRVVCLRNVADLMLFEREELVSLIMLEAGKSIDEAVADVDEAIDFVNFYIDEQINLLRSKDYVPKGVIGVIAPWNFPLAIPCGMTVAALVAGNTVVLKPAEQTNLIALKFSELLKRSGVTDDVFQLVLGEAEVGSSIVEHELVNGIVFTGSKTVGEMIYKKVSSKLTSAKYAGMQMNKFAITEMGGKNAIIVTNNCELDETISGILYSCFAHAGQKCSAASRIIIDEKIRPSFVQRFAEAIKDLKVGSALDYSTLINPVVTKEDQARIQIMAKQAREEVLKYGGKVVIDRSEEEFSALCVGPSVFELPAHVVLKNETMASREVFGPLVHIISFRDLDQAIEIFNSTEYALTGGIYAQSQDDIDYLLPNLQAGNIYINRPNTGARVAIEPFGGYKMSGTGPKAGSAEYLTYFNVDPSTYPDERSLDLSAEDNIKDYIAQFSKLSLVRRQENALRFLKVIIEQYEFLFGEVTETNKEKLINLKKHIKNGTFDLDTNTYPNRAIPGQTNYNMRNIAFGSGCIVDTSTTLDIQLVIDLFINLLVGNGVSVIATNNQVYTKWKLIVDWAYVKGFSNFNLSVSKLGEEELLNFLSSMNLKFCIFSDLRLPEKFKQAVLNKSFKDAMTRIFYKGQNATIEEGIKKFTHARSFAINTMRHGAPLDLEL